MKQLRRHLTYANVMSSIAVFLVLGGATAVAAKKVDTGQLKAGSVRTGKIAKEAVKAGKLAKNAVSTPKVATAAITAEKLADGSVTTAKLANDAVTGEKVNESSLGAVPTANIGLSPVAYARVSSEGTLIAANSRGITQSNVSFEGDASYCFKDLPFQFKSAMAVPDYGDAVTTGSGAQVSVALGNPHNDCASAQLEVVGEGKTVKYEKVGFFIWFFN